MLDICRMVYQPILTRDLQKQSSVVQSLRFFLGVLANLGRLYRMSRHPAKKAHEKFQFLFAIGILLLLSTYAIILIVALVQTILQIPQIAGALSAVVPKGSPATAGHAAPVVALTWSQLMVIIGAIIQTFAPNLG